MATVGYVKWTGMDGHARWQALQVGVCAADGAVEGGARANPLAQAARCQQLRACTTAQRPHAAHTRVGPPRGTHVQDRGCGKQPAHRRKSRLLISCSARLP